MIRRIFIILAIILLIGALKWESYGTILIVLSITILLSIIFLSMFDPISKKEGGKER